MFKYNNIYIYNLSFKYIDNYLFEIYLKILYIF
jgi:hypothetical protein